MASLVKPFAALGLVIACFSASPAFADTYHHIDDLAKDIERKARKIVSETRHYRHTPEYRHLLSDAKEIRNLADHIHDLAHDHGSLAHLESDVNELDAKFHHLEELFDRIECRAARGRGHIHGNTAHVKLLLNSIEDCIHHLQEDLRALRVPACDYHRRTVARPVYSAPPPRSWSHYGGRGITIGGGSTRFTIRF